MLGIKEPTYQDFNNTLADSWVETTAAYTNPNKNQLSLHKMSTIMKPFPRLGSIIQTVKITKEDEDNEKFIKHLNDTQSSL
mmetsp:Transcript_10524/g.9289  ORF Transcript_10524/g.9289 Transcript_10524/m.9289 type:complete len:81 (-) Transcript_10524:722-964(-)